MPRFSMATTRNGTVTSNEVWPARRQCDVHGVIIAVTTGCTRVSLLVCALSIVDRLDHSRRRCYRDSRLAWACAGSDNGLAVVPHTMQPSDQTPT